MSYYLLTEEQLDLCLSEAGAQTLRQLETVAYLGHYGLCAVIEPVKQVRFFDGKCRLLAFEGQALTMTPVHKIAEGVQLLDRLSKKELVGLYHLRNTMLKDQLRSFHIKHYQESDSHIKWRYDNYQKLKEWIVQRYPDCPADLLVNYCIRQHEKKFVAFFTLKASQLRAITGYNITDPILVKVHHDTFNVVSYGKINVVPSIGADGFH